MHKTLLSTLLTLAALATSALAADTRSDAGKALEQNALGASAVAASPDQLREWFREAPSILPDAKIPLKGQPLWHTNGELSDEVIREIIGGCKENGFGGITFLPLTKTTPKYLTEEYLTQYGKALDLADELGMKFVFYDDLDFPSGSAGWRLKEQFPEATMKRLDKVEWTVKGPAKFAEKSPIPFGDKVLYGKPEGVLQAAVAMNLDTFERVNIRDCVDAEGNVAWDVPEGNWKVFLFLCVTDPKGIVDYMSPDAVKKFFSLTYDVFYERFKKNFGTTITSIFFDDITNTQTQGSRNWALEFNDKYRTLFGKDPDLDYPALFYPIGDETPSARFRLWTTRNRLFGDGYPGMVKKWREEHGLDVVATGHPQGPYVIQPVDMSSDAMAAHRGSDAVLFDSIHYYGHGRDGFKVPTSAAFNYDFPFCFVEIYGNYRDNTFDSSMMLRSAMEIFARGGNVLLPHGTWTDPATVYIPPEISWRNPKLEGFLPTYGEFVSRNSLLMQGGRHVADFGILYPVDNLKAFFHFQFNFISGDYPYGVLLPRETDYMAVGSQLTTRIWRDFTFVHPDIVDEKLQVEKKDGQTLLKLDNASNWEEYQCFVLPGADVISWKNLEKIAAFYDAGGKLLATTRLPSIASEGVEYNAKVRETIERIFGVDPLTQAPRDAIATGQEDIVLPESFIKCREINKEGEYVQKLADETVAYEDTIYRDRAVFAPRPTTENLKAACDYLVPVPDVKIEPLDGVEIPTLNVVPRWDYPIDGMFQYMHKVKNGLDVYYFANSSNSPAKFAATLRGQFDALETWNPLTGVITWIESTFDPEKGTTTVKLELNPIECVYVVGAAR
ncbi:MAG: hypothetical protein IJM54_11885 [Thermoguttaceae bacterium]|nr:hypothetical protein [Thermoguttaceae bacterium]